MRIARPAALPDEILEPVAENPAQLIDQRHVAAPAGRLYIVAQQTGFVVHRARHGEHHAVEVVGCQTALGQILVRLFAQRVKRRVQMAVHGLMVVRHVVHVPGHAAQGQRDRLRPQIHAQNPLEQKY